MKKPELETRTCTCGCARTFRVLPASKQAVFSHYECLKKVPNGGRLEYEGTSSRLTRAINQGEEPKFDRDRKRNTQAKRNWSKWDKE